MEDHQQISCPVCDWPLEEFQNVRSPHDENENIWVCFEPQCPVQVMAKEELTEEGTEENNNE